MKVGRGHHNTVLLPDGSMVTVGGGVGIRNGDQWEADAAQRQVELRDPATGAWRLGPAQAESRAYHSTALLLPDGRVVSAGDDVNGGTAKDTAEIYEPPYLFKGARPAITAAPHNVRFATSFDVGTPNTNVTGAALVAPGATTHANDMNQRYIPLTVAQRAGGVTLTAPANPDVATPGYYMLFLLNDRGVPSVARFVSLGFVDEPPPTESSGSCVKAAKTVKGKTLSRARLGRKRKLQRRILASAKRRTRGNLDIYCVAGGGRLTVGYPTRALRKSLKPVERRRVQQRVALVLTSSPRFSLNGIERGDSSRRVRRRLAHERRLSVGKSLWFVATRGKSRVLVKVRGGKVRAIGMGNPKLIETPKETKRFLKSWTL